MARKFKSKSSPLPIYDPDDSSAGSLGRQLREPARREQRDEARSCGWPRLRKRSALCLLLVLGGLLYAVHERTGLVGRGYYPMGGVGAAPAGAALGAAEAYEEQWRCVLTC